MAIYASDGRPLPQPTATTQPFFDAARRHEFRLPRCPRDGFFYYPRSHCPRCLGDDWSWEAPSGLGEIYSYTIDRVSHDPAFRAFSPFAIAIVELEEGPRMTTRIADCAFEDLRVGLPVEVDFEDVDEVTLVRFRPRSSGSGIE